MTGFLPNFRRSLAKRNVVASARITGSVIAILLTGATASRAVPATDAAGAAAQFQISQEEKLLSWIPDMSKGVAPAD